MGFRRGGYGEKIRQNNQNYLTHLAEAEANS
jgi:hypothetical protein